MDFFIRWSARETSHHQTNSIMMAPRILWITLIYVLFCIRVDTHFHESLLPKGWGDVVQLKVAHSTRNPLPLVPSPVVPSSVVPSIVPPVVPVVVPPPSPSPSSQPPSTEHNSQPIINAAVVDSALSESAISYKNGEPSSSLPSTTTSTILDSETVEDSGAIHPVLEVPTPVNETTPKLVQFVWKVYNYTDIVNSGQELLFSPRFYLETQQPSPIGYRLQLLLVTNTTYMDSISYLGLFFRIVAGDYDASLEWPFKFRTVLSVLKHDDLVTLKSRDSNSNSSETLVEQPILYSEWNHTVVPNIDECRLRSAFLRPNSDSETGANTDGCGNRRHIPLSAIKKEHYSRDDTLLVLITVYLNEPIALDYTQFRRASMSMRYNELVSNYLWGIEQFGERERESTANGRIQILTSNPFYTHPNGYLIQLFLTILPKRNAFAISIAFVQGDHDRYLQWPFPYAFEMAIVDQSPDYWKRDLTVKVKPSKSDCGTEAFGQPGQQPEFCFLTIQSLQVLSLTHYNFLMNDTLKIRFTTRFERYSSRQRSSILLHNGRLVSEFNWLIPGLVARFERYIQESSNGPNWAGTPTSSASSATRKSHKFVSDEFYTNGQGYLCQLILTVTVRNIPIEGNTTTNPMPTQEGENDPNRTEPNNLPRMYQAQDKPSGQLSQDVLVFGLELVIIEGEYDRFLEWPFSAAYELSIVGYKNLASNSGSNSDSSNDAPKLYSFGPPNQANPKPSDSKRTSSTLVIPSQQVTSGQCAKEAFQKPIERNPPCGIREFVQLTTNLSEEARKQRSESFKSRVPPFHKLGSFKSRADQTIFNDSFSGHSHYELGTLTGKTDQDLHLRVRIHL